MATAQARAKLRVEPSNLLTTCARPRRPCSGPQELATSRSSSIRARRHRDLSCRAVRAFAVGLRGALLPPEWSSCARRGRVRCPPAELGAVVGGFRVTYLSTLHGVTRSRSSYLHVGSLPSIMRFFTVRTDTAQELGPLLVVSRRNGWSRHLDDYLFRSGLIGDFLKERRARWCSPVRAPASQCHRFGCRCLRNSGRGYLGQRYGWTFASGLVRFLGASSA